jgi:hypothetical protein
MNLFLCPLRLSWLSALWHFNHFNQTILCTRIRVLQIKPLKRKQNQIKSLLKQIDPMKSFWNESWWNKCLQCWVFRAVKQGKRPRKDKNLQEKKYAWVIRDAEKKAQITTPKLCFCAGDSASQQWGKVIFRPSSTNWHLFSLPSPWTPNNQMHFPVNTEKQSKPLKCVHSDLTGKHNATAMTWVEFTVGVGVLWGMRDLTN